MGRAKCKYTGEINEKNEAHGLGTTEEKDGTKYTGFYMDNKLYGFGR